MRPQDLESGNQESERVVRESEERYRSFVEQSTESIWRFELEEPCPTDLAPDEQVEHFYRHGYLAECNDAMARMYGYARAQEIVGARLGDLLPSSIPENVEYLRAFVRSGYRLADAESQEVDRHGNTKYFMNNLTGIVENESLVQVWGTQRDITERKRAEEALKRQARQAALRADVAAALSSGDAVRDVLRRCAEAMVRHLDAAFARVWTLNEEDVLELQASAGMYTHIDGPHSRVPVGELKIGFIAQERLPHLTNTVTSDPPRQR